jgi:hypothetical protein
MYLKIYSQSKLQVTYYQKIKYNKHNLLKSKAKFILKYIDNIFSELKKKNIKAFDRLGVLICKKHL